MTKHDLKELAAMGAELGAAKAANEKLRGLLREVRVLLANSSYKISGTAAFLSSIDNALSQQAEPTDTYTAVDMATAAAQGFRDGQAAAQDELRKRFDEIEFEVAQGKHTAASVFTQMRIAAMYIRPAQTEQQPVGEVRCDGDMIWQIDGDPAVWRRLGEGIKLYADPIAQTAPQGKFRMGDLVKKSTGSEWVGRVVGWYSTEQTKEGYAVESSAHRNSVQIYPAKALELVPMAAKEA